MIRKQYHGSREKELGRCWKEVTHKESGEFMLQKKIHVADSARKKLPVSKPHRWCVGKAGLIC